MFKANFMQQKYILFLLSYPVIGPKNDRTPSWKLYYFTTLNQSRFNVTFFDTDQQKKILLMSEWKQKTETDLTSLVKWKSRSFN